MSVIHMRWTGSGTSDPGDAREAIQKHGSADRNFAFGHDCFPDAGVIPVICSNGCLPDGYPDDRSTGHTRKWMRTHYGRWRVSMSARPPKLRRAVMTRFDFPEWLPTHMRHTAAPVRRLHSLLCAMQSLAKADRRPAGWVLAWKIRHLCRQIDPDACATPLSETCDGVLDLAVGILDCLPDGERPPAALIAAIHFTAGLCGSATCHRAVAHSAG